MHQRRPSILAGGPAGDRHGAAPTGDVVVLAIPYEAVADVLGTYGDRLDGKVVDDITNPVDFSTFTPLKLEAGCAAEQLAQQARAAKVVKAFNTTFAGTLVEGQVANQSLDVLVASDHADAKRVVSQLVEEGASARSTPVRLAARTSSRPSATCTWRCSSRSAPRSTAPSRSSGSG